MGVHNERGVLGYRDWGARSIGVPREWGAQYIGVQSVLGYPWSGIRGILGYTVYWGTRCIGAFRERGRRYIGVHSVLGYPVSRVRGILGYPVYWGTLGVRYTVYWGTQGEGYTVYWGTQCVGVPREQGILYTGVPRELGTRYIGVPIILGYTGRGIHSILGYTVYWGTPYIEVRGVCGLRGCLGTRRRVLSGCRVMGVRRDLGPGAASRETPRFRAKKREFLPIKSLSQASNGAGVGAKAGGGGSSPAKPGSSKSPLGTVTDLGVLNPKKNPNERLLKQTPLIQE